MKKLAMALGAAAVAVVSGCKDPDYRRAGAGAAQNDVKRADTVVAAQPVPAAPVAAKRCTCPPGTRHTAPCACKAPDCACIVVTKSAPAPAVVPAPVVVAPAEPEYTLYTVRGGDYLAKISKRFNVTIAAIKKLNNLKGDTIRVGQKLKIPGKVDVGAAPAPVKAKAAAAKPAKSSKAYKAYTGATKEYTVKSGDTLGAIAYAGGISLRQLKELNGLSSDVVRVGQKLKVPAEKVVKAKAAATAAAPAAGNAVAPAPAAGNAVAPAPAAGNAAAPAPATPAAEEPAQVTEAATAGDTAKVPDPVEPAPDTAAPATTTYVVQDGDDMTGVAIRWGVSASEVRALNNLSETDQIKPGQILKLPAEVQQ